MTRIVQDSEVVSNVTIKPPVEILIDYSLKAGGWTITLDGVTVTREVEVGLYGEVIPQTVVFKDFVAAMEWCDERQLIKTKETARATDQIINKIHKRGKKTAA